MPYKDKQKQKIAQHQSYLRNKKKVRDRSIRDRINKRNFIWNYKQQQHTCKCGEDDIRCKDIHHVKDKDFKLATAAANCGLERIKKELQKCEIICANCHRKNHKKDNPLTGDPLGVNRIRRDKNRKFVLEYKQSHCCSQCKETDPICLDFHHLGNKDIDINHAIRDWGLKRLKTEMEKCVVLCANCHRILHSRE